MKWNYCGHCLKLLTVLFALSAILVHGCTGTVSQASKQPSELQSSVLTIHYLNAPKQVQPLRGVEVLCIATDADNNSITYDWSATGGEIKPKGDSGALVLWVAPQKTGDYIVTVLVTNNKGSKVSRSATINVSDELPQQLTVTSMNCYGCTNGIEASKYKSYELRCVVASTNPDSLKYKWIASTGKIEGQGPNAYWITGAQYGNVLITVIVTDDQGNSAEGYLAINISCCH